MKFCVNITNDWTAGAWLHNVLVPPVVVFPSLSIEVPVPQSYPPGSMLDQHKLTKTVFHKGRSIVQYGHDIGVLIPDITPFLLANPYYAISWPLSKRKVAFGSEKVEMEKVKVGAAQIGLIPFPMVTCGDPCSAPLAFPINNRWNTVECGTTLKYYLITWAGIAANMILEVLITAFFKGLGMKHGLQHVGSDLVAKRFWRGATNRLADRFSKDHMKKLGQEAFKKLWKKDPAKRVGEALTGLGTSAATGNPTFKLAPPNPWLGVGNVDQTGKQTDRDGKKQ